MFVIKFSCVIKIEHILSNCNTFNTFYFKFFILLNFIRFYRHRKQLQGTLKCCDGESNLTILLLKMYIKNIYICTQAQIYFLLQKENIKEQFLRYDFLINFLSILYLSLSLALRVLQTLKNDTDSTIIVANFSTLGEKLIKIILVIACLAQNLWKIIIIFLCALSFRLCTFFIEITSSCLF